MANVLRVTAGELGNPVAFGVLVESTDRGGGHEESVDPSPLEWQLSLGRPWRSASRFCTLGAVLIGDRAPLRLPRAES